MFRIYRRFAPGLLLLAALGGCPLTSLTGTPTDNPANSSDVAGAGASSATAPPVGRATTGFEQQLSSQFPSCDERLNVDRERDQLLQLVNQARGTAGLGAVRRNEVLERQASQYACEMIEGGFFSHINPITNSTLRERAEEFGYDFRVIGENLAAGQETVTQAFEDWMNSPAHRENILDPRFTELGIGIRTGGDYGVYWVQEFGEPLE